MEELAKLEAERGAKGYAVEEPAARRVEQTGDKKNGKKEETQRRASNEMCGFLILNISSLQLIPVNMIAYRSQYGSARPAAVIAPAIAATLVSTLTAVIYCKIKDRSGLKGGGSV